MRLACMSVINYLLLISITCMRNIKCVPESFMQITLLLDFINN